MLSKSEKIDLAYDIADELIRDLEDEGVANYFNVYEALAHIAYTAVDGRDAKAIHQMVTSVYELAANRKNEQPVWPVKKAPIFQIS